MSKRISTAEMSGAPKVLIVAGEASGDVHAARVVRELKAIRPDIDVYGVGGDALAEAGARLIAHIRELSTFGIFEVFRKLPDLARIFYRIVGSVRDEKPSVAVLVDYPDFNLRLAKALKKRYGSDLKILYYIAPQVWIWRKGRAKTMARLVDRLAVVFPFESDVFRQFGAQVDFVGHPLLETIPRNMTRSEARKKIGVDENSKLVALLPGSRHGEIKNYMPELAKVIAELKGEGYEFVVARAPTVTEDEISVHLKHAGVEARQIVGDTHATLAAADFAVVALGTATLETALMGCPGIFIGIVQPLSYWFGFNLLGLDIPYYSLPNFILGRKAYPELIQDAANGADIAKGIRELMGNPKALESLRKAASDVQKSLWSGEENADGSGGTGLNASSRTANIIDSMTRG